MAYNLKAFRIESIFKKAGYTINYEYGELLIIDNKNDDIIGFDELEKKPKLIELAKKYTKIQYK